MKRLTLAAALLAVSHLASPTAEAALVAPSNLDGLDLGVQVMADRTSDFMTPDLTSQGGAPPRSTGTLTVSVWLKNGLYTYRLVVTPTETPSQFSTQFN